MKLQGKKILLGIGGSISAYKVPELVRLLKKEGAEVRVMISRAGRRFVTPLTLETLTGEKVLTGFFKEGEALAHIKVSRSADLLLVAPATANMLAKFSYGMADDLISATVLAAKCPVLIAPAMNERMWKNYLVQENCGKLSKAGYNFVGPQLGDLACGEVGEGRLIDLNLLIDEIVKVLSVHDLKKKKVIITAGPTREYADPVRFLSNDSSGKMGIALAKESYYRGAEVTLIGAISETALPGKINLIKTVSAWEMHGEVMKRIGNCDIFIANAAVSDYGFKTVSKRKIKKTEGDLKLTLKRNDDILGEVGMLKKRPFVVGFCLETDNLLENGRKKMLAKNADLMVVNSDKAIGSNRADADLLFKKDLKKKIRLENMLKEDIAKHIIANVVKLV
jgi:phosphopantothenoylcysteine decarboxylase/phosphopantothenate--cysteine ligase